MATFADSVALFVARMQANDPSWALDDTSDLMKITKAILAFDNDTNNLITATTPNYYLLQASGVPLAQKASDYGYNASQGTPSSGTVVFKLASGVSSGATVIPATTVLQVAGDGVTTPTLSFYTQQSATIPNGASSSGSPQISTLTFNGAPTFGTTTFTVTVGSQTTGTISYQTNGATTAANIQTALNTLLGAGNTIVASTSATVYTVQFVGALSGLIQTVSAALVTQGGGTSISSAITSPVTGVTYTATTTGLATNIGAGASLVIQNPLSGVVASNATADGGTAFTGGTDPDPDAFVRANALKNILPKYGVAALMYAMLSVSGVYDAWVYDPQDGSGKLGYAFCDSSGNTPGATGLNTIPTTGSVTTQTPTITSGALADQVRTALNNVLPPGMTALGATPTANMYAFSVQALSAIPITYSAPAAIQSSSIQAQIAQAVVNFVQGSTFSAPSFQVPASIGPQTGLYHGLALVPFALQQYVQQAVGGVLTNISLGVTTPASTTASNATVYRCVAGTSAVSFTRV